MKKSSFANKSIGVITVIIIYILSLETSLIAQVNTVRKLKALSTLKSKPVSTSTNPVLNQNFADPTVIKAEDGYDYAYATNDGVNGIAVNI